MAKSGSRHCSGMAEARPQAERAGIPALSPTSMISKATLASPVAAAPVTAVPAPVMPAPVAAVPAPVAAPPAPVAMPAHLFGLQMFHLAFGGDGGTGTLARRRQLPVICERMGHKRRGLRAGGQRSRTRGKSNGKFQKIAAFHEHLPLGARWVMPREFRRVE